MGTELIRSCIKDEEPIVPPGFEHLARGGVREKMEGCLASSSISESRIEDIESMLDISNAGKITRSLRRRPWINYSSSSNNSMDECNSNKLNHNLSLRPSLAKGVIRGCPECATCQKVTARWRPKDAHKPDLEDAPVFHPSEQEFKDTLKYIASIRPIAEAYGICRIVPPPSWKPPCLLKENIVWENSKFATRVQRVDKLQNRGSKRKMSQTHNQIKKKRRRCTKMGVYGRGGGDIWFHGEAEFRESERFGFEPGPEFTLNEFQMYADDFKAQYFGKNGNDTDLSDNKIPLLEKGEPTVEIIEGEYWRMVEKPTEEIEVLYGADLETGVFGSGFPTMSNGSDYSLNDQYVKSGWNLNNFPRLHGSVLSYESSDISGVLVPWLYVGMCFSSFCWHVEDHHLYSLNYMHWGAPKLWYGVPGRDFFKLEMAMRKHLPDLFEEQPDLLHKLVTQLSPSILKTEGVPVYRCVQNSGEFVLTFPRAYHAGFNCGFNCAEAVNVAPIDWLPHGQNAIELYREQGRKTSISHDKLLLGAAREAVKANWELTLLKKNTSDNYRWRDVCGKDGILTKALKVRVEMERTRREFLCSSLQASKMESDFDANCERECNLCLFDLHLSAVGCRCSPEIYACLNHAKQLCSCAWGAKFSLFRYDNNELNILVEALEGKLSAIYRWARLDLGLALSSYASKDGLQVTVHNEVTSDSSETSLKDLKAKEHLGNVSSRTNEINVKPSDTALASIDTNVELSKKNRPVVLSPNLKLPPCEPSHEDLSSTQKLATVNLEGEKSSIHEHENVILLSDDEREEPSNSNHRSAFDDEMNKSMTKSTMVGDVNFLVNEERSNYLISPKDEGEIQVAREENDDVDKYEKVDHHTNAEMVDNERSVSESPSCSPNNLDRYYRQKGPRIAKVVRRINCNVEPLDFGAVVLGKAWCNSQSIFPKGFRSRVRYISVLDPTNMCYYVSEILDAGRDGPLFMVSLEHCPNEVFVHVSATRCWEMVRERVNQEISKRYKLGKLKLPPLQPPGSLDGLEMFGFCSPSIVQAIEAMDQNRVSTEYWNSRPFSRFRAPTAEPSLSNGVSKDPPHNREAVATLGLTLRGLLKKANPEELHALCDILSSDEPKTEQGMLGRLLSEEIENRRG